MSLNVSMQKTDIIKEITDYSLKVGLSSATVCRRAVGNSRLPARLQAGQSCTIRTLEKLRAYMAENPPKAGGAS